MKELEVTGQLAESQREPAMHDAVNQLQDQMYLGLVDRVLLPPAPLPLRAYLALRLPPAHVHLRR